MLKRQALFFKNPVISSNFKNFVGLNNKFRFYSMGIEKSDKMMILTKEEIQSNLKLTLAQSYLHESLIKVKEIYQDRERKVSSFISYSHGNNETKTFVENLAECLEKAGINVFADKGLSPGNDIQDYMKKMETCDIPIVIGTPDYKQKSEAESKPGVIEYGVKTEERIAASRKRKGDIVIPILLKGTLQESFGTFFTTSLYKDFTSGNQSLAIIDILGLMYKVDINKDEKFIDIRNSFLSKNEQLKSKDMAHAEYNYHIHKINSKETEITKIDNEIEGDAACLLSMKQKNEEEEIEALNSKLTEAASKGQLNLVKAYLNQGADPNYQDKKGLAAVHYGASFGRIDMFEALRTYSIKKIDFDIRDNLHGGNALHFASAYEHIPAILWLVNNAKINVNSPANGLLSTGTIALHWAAGQGRVEAIKILNQLGSDINHKDNKGLTPLHWAASQDKLFAIKFLLTRGADINALANNGTTPLHWAADNGKLDALKLLIEKGADLDLKDINGLTVIDYARKLGSDNIIEFLENYRKELFLKIK